MDLKATEWKMTFTPTYISRSFFLGLEDQIFSNDMAVILFLVLGDQHTLRPVQQLI